MSDAVFVIGLSAAVIALVGGVFTIRRRGPLWQLLSAGQFGLMGMMFLVVISNGSHSATLHAIDTAYALGFIAFSLFVWNIQKRLMSGR